MPSKRCPYGVKKDGGCKKKPGRKPKRSRSRSQRKSRRKSRCPYGVKKDGGCKKKPGSKPNRSRSRRKSRRKSRRNVIYMTEARCKAALKEKIRINIREYKDGKYSSRQQAIAVAYSILSRKHPNCKKIFKRLRESR